MINCMKNYYPYNSNTTQKIKQKNSFHNIFLKFIP